MHVDLHTDGSCVPNPGRGGWAAILVYRKELSGSQEDTTNNAMEMQAILRGLLALKRKCNVAVHTDSTLVVGWLDKNWKCKHRHIRVIRDEILAMGHALTFVLESEGNLAHDLAYAAARS